MNRCTLVIAGALFLAACEPVPTPPAVLVEQLQEHGTAFLQDGRTTREQIVLKLGTPSSDFENGRILTYRLHYDAKRGMSVEPRDVLVVTGTPSWDGISGSLVLIFDEHNILQRHSLVPMSIALSPEKPAK